MLLLLRKKLTSRLSPLGTAPAFTSSLSSLLSSSTESPPPTSQFAAVQYLITSCGLPSDKALRASRYISHLKSPEKPDSVLQFLRQSGVTEPHITAAALADASFLRYNVEKRLKPQLAALSDLGFSPLQISLLFSLSPAAFKLTKLPQNIQFWMPIFGSVEKLLSAVKKGRFLITVNLENSVIPNLSFLQEKCGFSVRQILYLIMSVPRTITSRPEALKIRAERAEELGLSRSSPMFVHALITVCCLNQKTIDAKLSNLTSLGFSQQEVTTLVSKFPFVLLLGEELMGHKIEFLTKEMGCDKLQLFSNPSLLGYSLEKRLIPRSRVRKLLGMKGFPVANLKWASFMHPSQKVFLKKFVMPYEDAIPGLHQAYMDACAGIVEGLQWFNRALKV